jgi:hypothetical protein
LIPLDVQTQLAPPTRGGPPSPSRSGHKKATSGTRNQLLSGTAKMTLTLMPNHFVTHLTQIGHLADEGCTFLRNVGEAIYYTASKYKRRPSNNRKSP